MQQQIKHLEKQNKIGQHNITYKGGFFSEYIEDLKEVDLSELKNSRIGSIATSLKRI